jgi:hypothetical protein
MTIDELNFLQSGAGAKLLRQYGGYDEASLLRLLFKSAKKSDGINLAPLVTLIKLRRQATAKFPHASDMFFTPLGLEQATGEHIANLIAARFQPEWTVADLTASIGGNLIGLAKRCRKVIAVDKNPENLSCARVNITLEGLSGKVEFILGDANDNIRNGVDAFFLDPARDRDGKSKTRSILNSEPQLLKILPLIFKITPNVGVKISPAFDYEELALLPEEPEVEIISEDNNCKVAMLWFGALKKNQRSASCLCKGNLYFYKDNPAVSRAGVLNKPGVYIYEPNKAISKAHLVDELAAEYGLKKLNPRLAFLSGGLLVAGDKPGLFRIFKVRNCQEFSARNFQAFLKENKIDRADILAKEFPLGPEEILKKFKLREGGGLTFIFLTLNDGKRYYILAERV